MSSGMSVDVEEVPVDALAEAGEEEARELLEEAIRRWFSASQRHLNEAVSQRADLDSSRDQRGSLEGRRSNGMYAILQSGMLLGRDADGDLAFGYTHPAAEYHEFGTEPHTIRPDDGDVLAFKWPDAPDGVVDMFTAEGEDRSDWDGWVYFPKVEHPGNPAIGFVTKGRNAAVDFLREGGP